ncbi:type II secretion system ATPase GspE [soil metagenome]
MATDLQAKLNALGDVPPRAVAAVDLILKDAADRGASDVHFEPWADKLTVRFRLDGVVQPVATLPKEIAANVIARLKVLAELLTYRLDIPQEGGVRRDDGSDLRISTFPTIHGEKAVVRFFMAKASLTRLDQLGLGASQCQQLANLLTERTGAILLTGPSGSGKTTTVYACLEHLRSHQPGRQIVTIEDPVERTLEGVVQSQVRPGTEFDFARGLRSLLRQDPEVIAVGEIRDRDTAATATEAALTGHLLISTLHAGSAAGVVTRLLEMGLEPYLLTSSLRGILNQRLLRRFCDECHGQGCPQCANSGYRGRFLISEMVVPDAAFRQLILNRADTDTLAKQVVEGQTTLRAEAERAVKAGVTSTEEVVRVLGLAHGLTK